MTDIVFRNIHILEGRETAYPWRGALAIMVSDEGTYRNVLFEDIVLDGVRGAQLLSVDFCKYNTKGREVSDVIFRNIRSHNCRFDFISQIRGLDDGHKVQNIRFDNILVNGIRIDRDNFSEYFEVNPFVEDIMLDSEEFPALP